MKIHRTNPKHGGYVKRGRGYGSDDNLETRIGQKIEQLDSGCWLYRGQGNQARFVYETLVAPIAATSTLTPTCRTRRCCNPLHLAVDVEPLPTGPGNYIVGETDRADRRLKIGVTNDLRRRMAELQTGPSPVELLWWSPAGGNLSIHQLQMRERKMHLRWAHLRIHGEWFKDEGDLAEFVRQPFDLGDV